MPPPPYSDWRWASPPPREEPAAAWKLPLDLEAAAALPPTMPDATANETAADCDSVARLFTGINFLRAMLLILWMSMVYAMIRYAMNHWNEEGRPVLITFLILITLCVTPYFDIAAQALDDLEARSDEK